MISSDNLRAMNHGQLQTASVQQLDPHRDAPEGTIHDEIDGIYKPLYFTLRTFYKRLFRQMITSFGDKFDMKQTA